MNSVLPLILFGAFDRHNFGDVLLGEIAAARAGPRPVVFAGLATRDLTAAGGRRVRALADVARELGGRPADVLLVGGEILGCPRYEAAIMLLDGDAARAAIARLDRDAVARDDWAADMLRTTRRLPYLPGRDALPAIRSLVATGIGGVDFASLSPAARDEAVRALSGYNRIAVRDRATLAALAAAGIDAVLAPDPAVQVVSLFGRKIAARACAGEPGEIRRRFPQGYVALQFSADFGDDATLRILAVALQAIVSATGLGIVVFRAGLAPWHDDDDTSRRLLAMASGTDAALFRSPDILDTAALLAGARAYAGSSLHARIVAEAFARPAASIARDAASGIKLAAYAETWGGSAPVTPEGLAPALLAALAGETEERAGRANALAATAAADTPRGVPGIS